MNTGKKLISILVAAATMGAAAPVFADSRHGDYRGGDRYNNQDRRDNRAYGREFERHRVVPQRPYAGHRAYVGQPYYQQPAAGPYYQQRAGGIGLGAVIGAMIGTIIYDSQR